MAVSFPVPDGFNAVGTVNISDFRSYRTSRLFVPNDECWYQLECKNDFHKKAIKTAVHRINQYVAKNGGWTYVGWLRTGSVSDESDDTHKGVENIASEKQDPHISYLYPTKPDVRFGDERRVHEVGTQD